MLQSTSNETATQTQGYLHDLTFEIMAALAALAAVETRYRTKCEALPQVFGPETLKKRFSEELELRHLREREPLVQRLVELHYSLTVTSVVREPHAQH